MSTYKAKRVPAHRGPAAWNEILGPASQPIAVTGDLEVDFAMIGGGFAGLSAARRLSQLNPGARIAVLEASRIAEGASGRNSGFMIDLPHDLASDNYSGHGTNSDRTMIDLNRNAIGFARSAVEEYQIPAAFFDPVGKINGAASEAADGLNQSYSKHLSAMGEANTRLDAKQMQELTGSSHYVSGLFTPGTVILQPAGYIRSLALGLRKNGISVFENSPVVAMTRTNGFWHLQTKAGIIKARVVILTNNGHLESFGFAENRLMHVFLYASMTVNMDAATVKKLGGAPRWGVTPSDPMGTTMRRIDTPLGGNRIVTRTCATFEPGMEPDAKHLKRTAKVHREKFNQRFPNLAEVPMEYVWAGHLCLSKNGVAVMKQLDDGLFSACVQNGLGTARGTLTGMGAAEMASGVQSPITRHFTAEPPPLRLPPKPFSTIGANMFLRWKERRAGAE